MIQLDQRQHIRVSQVVGGRDIVIAYCRSVAEVAVHVDLADLVEVIPMRAARRPKGSTSAANAAGHIPPPD